MDSVLFSCLEKQTLQDLAKKEGVKAVNFQVASKVLLPEKPSNKYAFGKLNLMFYVDAYGDYFENNTKVAAICRAVHDSLEKEDQKAMMKYIMDSVIDEDE